jgi:3-methyladenine DNA glycosylase AlkD
MNNQRIINELKKELIRYADKKYKQGAENVYKSDVRVIGAPLPIQRKIAKDFYPNIKHLDKGKIFKLADDLFKTNYFEMMTIATDWVRRQKKDFKKADFKIFELWVKKYINNWATCDDFCNHVLADFIKKYPEFIKDIKKWARAKNFWLRRGAAVTFVVPGRKGKFLKDILQIAKILLEDKEDLVQKGYGWMLKEASKAHPEEVFDFVMKNKSKMPRTALRYAIEKYPPAKRAQAMAK